MVPGRCGSAGVKVLELTKNHMGGYGGRVVDDEDEQEEDEGEDVREDEGEEDEEDEDAD